MLPITGDMWSLLSSSLELQGAKRSSTAGRNAGYFEAEQMLDNAKARLATGSREASEVRYRGRISESDAVAAMAGQGGETDPVLLAKIREKTSYNALAALFDAEVDSNKIKDKAALTRYQAAAGHSANMFSAGTTFLSKSMPLFESGAQSFSKWMDSRNKPTGKAPLTGPHG
jgi:hypothetical protein